MAAKYYEKASEFDEEEEEVEEEEEEDLHHLLMSPSPSARSTASSLADIMGEFSLDSSSGNNTPKAAPPTPSAGKGAMKFVQVNRKYHHGCLSILSTTNSHITSQRRTECACVSSASSTAPFFACACYFPDRNADGQGEAGHRGGNVKGRQRLHR